MCVSFPLHRITWCARCTNRRRTRCGLLLPVRYKPIFFRSSTGRRVSDRHQRIFQRGCCSRACQRDAMDLAPNHCGTLHHSRATICTIGFTCDQARTGGLIGTVRAPHRLTLGNGGKSERYGSYPRYRPYRKATNCFAPRILFLTFSSVTPPCRSCCSNLINASFNSFLNSLSITRSSTLGIISSSID